MTGYKMFLSLPPSVNCAYIHTKKGYTFLSPMAKAWKEEAVWLIHEARIPIFKRGLKIVVEVKAYWPDKRVRDMNNLSKITCDAIQDSGIVENDKVILWREMDYITRPNKPGIELMIYEKGE